MALVIPVIPNSSNSSDSKGKVGITKDRESCPDDYWGSWGKPQNLKSVKNMINKLRRPQTLIKYKYNRSYYMKSDYKKIICMSVGKQRI